LLGVSIPAGPGRVIASYIHKDDRTAFNQDASQYAIGYTYALSKRTDLYTAYGLISNENGASYTVNSAIDTGSGNRAVNLGMRHLF
jgi:predicted porin